MKVVNRKQVTEVVTKRLVTHNVTMGDTEFVRYESMSIIIPYMDCVPTLNKNSVTWYRQNGNVLTKLTKKEIELLALEQRFNLLDLDSKNGNIF